MTDRRVGHGPWQILRARDLAPVVLDDYVTALEPRRGRRRVVAHARHEGALRLGEMEALGEVRRDSLDRHAEPAALHVARRRELGDNALGQRDRDGEADTDGAAGLAEHGRVDPDRLAARIDERAAAVAGIDGGVGLDEVVVRAFTDHAAGRTDDTGGDRLLEPERIADGHDRLAHLKRLPAAERDHGEVLQQREIGLRVASLDLRGELAAVGHLHLDLGGPVDHVVIGDDGAVGADDEARADAVPGAWPRGAPELAEEVVERVVVAVRRARPVGRLEREARADVDDCGLERLGQLDPVRRRRRGGLDGGRRVGPQMRRCRGQAQVCAEGEQRHDHDEAGEDGERCLAHESVSP